MSLARHHKMRLLAATAAAVAVTEGNANYGSMQGSAYELMFAQLVNDRARLKQVQSEQGKGQLKSNMLPTYADYVEGVLSANTGAKDEIITTLMLWYVDAGDYLQALRVGRYVLTHQLPMPDRFQRTAGCALVEEIANTALKAFKANLDFDLGILEQTVKLFDDIDDGILPEKALDMPDEVKAKIYQAFGKALLKTEDDSLLGVAQFAFSTAMDLNAHCGSKKELDKVEAKLKALEKVQTSPAEQTNDQTQATTNALNNLTPPGATGANEQPPTA